MTCPDANQLNAFLEGHLPESEAARIEEHIDACPDCRRMIAFGGSSDGDLANPVEQPEQGGVEGLVPGDKLDNFIIVRRLGAGGMGEVYLAKDAELSRRVAIKVIRSDRIGSAREVDRFVREARVTARLNHPGIVTIYAIGRAGDTPYLALEYIEGETLRDRLRTGILPPRAWVPIARAIAEAAREAHRHLIVHGDLKPSNVLLGRDGRVRTLDFGLARFVHGMASASTDLTVRSGSITETGIQGTPAYMAPEQWDAQPATPASDVWALGVMVFEMAVGAPPFTVSAVARGQVDAAIACDAARASGVEIPAIVEDLLVRCLDASAERRPTMQQVLESLIVLDRTLELPSLSPQALPWGESASGPSGPSAIPSAVSAPGSSRSEPRWRGRATLLASVIVVSAAIGFGVWWPRDPTVGPASSASVPAPAVSHPAVEATNEAPAVSAAQTVSSTAPAASGPGKSPAVASGTPPASATGSSRPAKPPLPSMRLAALSHLEDKAEEASLKASSSPDPAVKSQHRQLAKMYRSMADNQLNEVERLATEMRSKEPSDAARLLDYVSQGRTYLRQRRLASGAL